MFNFVAFHTCVLLVEKRRKSRQNGSEAKVEGGEDKDKVIKDDSKEGSNDDSSKKLIRSDDKGGEESSGGSKGATSGDVEEIDDDDEEEEYMDEAMQHEDSVCRHDITTILNDHRRDILNYIPPPSRADMREKKMSKVQSKLAALSGGMDIAGVPSAAVRKVAILEIGYVFVYFVAYSTDHSFIHVCTW